MENGGIRPKQNNRRIQPENDRLNKYLKAEMPVIHDAHPTAIFDLVDGDVLDEWESYPEGKLAVYPFGTDIQDPDHLRDLCNLLFNAVVDIAQAQEMGISAPKPNVKAMSIHRHPTTFLVYNLTEEQRKTLLQREVWASQEITFRVAPTDPSRPKYLFSISGYTSQIKADVRELVLRTWTDEISQEFFNTLSQDMETDDCNLPQLNLVGFIKSLSVNVLPLVIRKKKPNSEDEYVSILTPRFYIYADSDHIPDFQTWAEIRHFLANRIYQSTKLGQGTNFIAPHNCGICHGADHPRGFCQFPDIPNWCGPKRRVENREKGGNNRSIHFPKAKKPRF